MLKNTDLAKLKSDLDQLDINKLNNITNNVSNLKSKIEKLNANELAPVLVDLNKLTDIVKNVVLKKIIQYIIQYIMLRLKILKIKYLKLLT